MLNRPSFPMILMAASMIASSGAVAQGANVDVTVFPQATAAQPVTTRAGFLVCVGTATDLDQFGTELTPTSGVANQNFRNLPVGAAVRVTVTKAGYTGVQLNTTLRADWNNHLQASLFPGTGGPACAAASTTPPAPTPAPAPAPAPVRLDGRPIYPIAPAPASAPAPVAPRLGEQVLTHRGRVIHQSLYSTLDCRMFGTNFVMTGISGTSGQGVDRVRVRCTQVNSSGAVGSGTSAVVRSTDEFGGEAGTAFTRNCPSGQAVVGIRGTLEREQVRGIGLQCKSLSGGLATGSVTNTTTIAGGTVPSPWGPDNCGQGRPARALKAGRDIFLSGIPLGNLFAPYVVAAVQLICEQPTQ